MVVKKLLERLKGGEVSLDFDLPRPDGKSTQIHGTITDEDIVDEPILNEDQVEPQGAGVYGGFGWALREPLQCLE